MMLSIGASFALVSGLYMKRTRNNIGLRVLESGYAMSRESDEVGEAQFWEQFDHSDVDEHGRYPGQTEADEPASLPISSEEISF